MKFLSIFFFLASLPFGHLYAHELHEGGEIAVKRSSLQITGDGKEIARKNPSDIIKVGNLFYIWYLRSETDSKTDVSIYYATSKTGLSWTEKGSAITAGKTHKLSSPNILVTDGKFYLLHTKKVISDDHSSTTTHVSIATATSPDGPWDMSNTDPVITSGTHEDSQHIDKLCLLKQKDRYNIYYVEAKSNNNELEYSVKVATSSTPEGPYKKYEKNPVIKGVHKVNLWPYKDGVSALITRGAENAKSYVLHAKDGFYFEDQKRIITEPLPTGGYYRPEAFTGTGKGGNPSWGVETLQREGTSPTLGRFDIQWHKHSQR